MNRSFLIGSRSAAAALAAAGLVAACSSSGGAQGLLSSESVLGATATPLIEPSASSPSPVITLNPSPVATLSATATAVASDSQAVSGQEVVVGDFHIGAEPDWQVSQLPSGGSRIQWANGTLVDLAWGDVPSTVTVDGLYELDSTISGYFGSSTYDLTSQVSDLTYVASDGSTQRQNVLELVAAPTQIWGAYYTATQTPGQSYTGLLIIVIRPNDELLTVDAYAPAENQVDPGVLATAGRAVVLAIK
jgi:hypothetical protein